MYGSTMTFGELFSHLESKGVVKFLDPSELHSLEVELNNLNISTVDSFIPVAYNPDDERVQVINLQRPDEQ